MLILRDERRPGDSRHLSVKQHRGGILIEQHDLGDGVEAVFGEGCREYELTMEVKAAAIEKLVDALGAAPGTPVLDAIRAACADEPGRLFHVLRDAAVPHEVVWSRIGD